MTSDGGEISLNGDEGDDTIIFGGNSAGSSANGGEGNDTLIARNLGGGVAGKLFGGNGDDIMSVDPENLIQNAVIEMSGQAGNDVLSNTTGSENISLSGGEGNDTLNVSFDINDNGDGGDLRGGLGADTFNIEMLVGEASSYTSEGPSTQISDFTKGEDILNLIIDAPAGGDYNFDTISIVTPEENTPLGAITEIRVTFNAVAEGARPIVSIIRLDGITELTLDDIIVTQR